jgi:hypothetical protein
MAAICIGLVVTSARGEIGGSLDSPAAPTDPASAMWTLKDIYDVLDTRATNVTKRTSFVEPTGGPTNGTMHTLNDIMTLVTNRAPVPKTGQTPTLPSFTPNPATSDGKLQIGVAWPNPRFTVLGDTNAPSDPVTNQIRDNLTGLIWARDALNAGGWASTTTNWGAAVTNCNDLDYGGQTDWRLPNERELKSLTDSGNGVPALCNTAGTKKWSPNDPFTGVITERYWSSSTLAAGTGSAWYVTLFGGDLHYISKTSASKLFVWPVRGGQ